MDEELLTLSNSIVHAGCELNTRRFWEECVTAMLRVSSTNNVDTATVVYKADQLSAAWKLRFMPDEAEADKQEGQ